MLVTFHTRYRTYNRTIVSKLPLYPIIPFLVDDVASVSDDEDFFSITNDVDVDVDNNGFVRVSSPYSNGFGMGDVVANLLDDKTAIAVAIATGECVGDEELPHSLPQPFSLLLLLYPKSVMVEDELERDRLEGGPDDDDDFVVWVALAS